MVDLLVNGLAYGGWQAVEITRGIEQLAGKFHLDVSERWAGQGKAWPIGEGDECSVVVGGVPVITGWLDRRVLSIAAGAHSVSVEGRDRTGDLVDCSALLDKWEFHDVDVLTLARKLCDPYGVDVSVQTGLSLADVSIPKKYSIDPGDTVSAALENLCRVAGVLAVSDGTGGIVLSRAGVERCSTTIVEGANLKAGTATYDASGRFHDYWVLGSHKGRDDLSGASAAAVKGTATDETARAVRRLVIRPEGNVTTAQASKRAQWEAAVRAGRADTVSVTVPGWTQDDGTLWPLNGLVRVKAPSLAVDGTMLIAGLTLTRGTDGTLTQLDLRDPAAFDPVPVLKPQGAGSGLWKEIARGV